MKTTKNMNLLKIGVGIVLILAVPILFFQLLGVNLLNAESSNKRIIAIVNEDLGLSKDDETVEMGEEVVSILAEDSQYEWKVMSRGTAVNGLKSNQHEAIVYIPSDFSESIMSYDQQNPEQAEFSYDVQRQKAGSQKEKVLHEIETATNRVNEKVSTLYWSYVAQEMDHIKKEFTTILGKETEFLTAMTAYYKPGSEKLANEMQNQKKQMDGLRSVMNDASNGHTTRIENAGSFGQQMDSFITYVQQYKQFQQQQKNILQQVQDDSLAKIHAAAATQVNQFNESVQTLEENNNKLNSEIEKVNEKLNVNKEKFNALSDLRKNEVDRQLEDLLYVQGTAIDRYNNSILSNLEQGIAAGKDATAGGVTSNPTAEQQQMIALKEEMDRKASAKLTTILPGLEEEQNKVTAILAALSAMKASVAETNPDSTFIGELELLEGELTAMNAVMSEKAVLWSGAKKEGTDDYVKAFTDYKELIDDYDLLNKEYESVQQILNASPADTAQIIYQIKLKEKSLLKHEGLTGEQRNRLAGLFAKGAASTETKPLLAYYATLEQFGFTLDEQGQSTHKDGVLKDEILTALLKNVVEINELELEGWTSVGDGIPETELGMSELSTTFAAIMFGYKETVEEQHSALLNELDSIDDQANVLLKQIQNTSGEPVAASSEGEVAASQKNVSSQLVTLSGMMNSLSERQKGLVNYANDLTVKADDMKKTSTAFSDKWETNASEMSAFDTDIQDFLGNTYVDGQENGYAFNHFVNPLLVKGEAAFADEVRKVPPVILLLILLISSLLIGFFSYQTKGGPIGFRLGLTGMLSLLVGLIISLYSINMYVLNDQRAVEWTIFTILLLLASAAVIRAALELGQMVGWIASVVLMCLYITPLLILAVPEINIPDILSTVYMSIKYEPETNFIWGAVLTGIIAIAMLAVSYFIHKYKTNNTSTAEQAHEN
ncbi:type VII secretion protein EsaA [Sporosarcina sp. ANT_H38]|uniref:type VII secretion protein EsaA n=1 Tax=Sporosarcina sp. ANT_H38 TaxID=2597358 RepID=UPI0011F193D7|nr:type VII secretion protein EsaA [Sporosarcina sp. ANT_H38]KAA0955570.1 type VII secretion protein EsaA [Sporosarcina sp. ANT_H38]